MSEVELRKLLSSYRNRAVLILTVIIFISFSAHHFLIKNAIEVNLELGLPSSSTNLGFTWGGITFGLNAVLLLNFYFFEKILIKILSDKV